MAYLTAIGNTFRRMVVEYLQVREIEVSPVKEGRFTAGTSDQTPI